MTWEIKYCDFGTAGIVQRFFTVLGTGLTSLFPHLYNGKRDK